LTRPATGSGAAIYPERTRLTDLAERALITKQTAHLGEEATAQLRHALARLREITDPYH